MNSRDQLKKWEESFVEQTLLLDSEDGIPSEHLEAVHKAVVWGAQGRHISPHFLDELLSDFGYREDTQDFYTDPCMISEHLWWWCRTARKSTSVLANDAAKTAVAFALHHEFMRIRPFQKHSGSIGRILLANHLILLGLKPQIILAADRKKYERWIRIQLA